MLRSYADNDPTSRPKLYELILVGGSGWSPNDGAPDNPIRRGMDRNAYRPRQTPGGYLRGCAKTEVALRDELPRPAEFAAADRPHAKGPVLPILRRSTLSAA